MPKFYIGTAGWSYKDWVPNFYPKNQSKNFDWLKFYSEYFNVVEVNSTYYAFINPNVVNGWIRKVEDKDDFLFTLKLHQNFTHKRNYSDKEIKAFQYYLDMLKREERLGGMLMQFPYSFYFNSANANYLRELIKVFEGYDIFVEVRHSSWQNKSAHQFLFENKVSLCTIDQPEIGKSISFNPVITNDKAYLRFHGRNEEAWKNSINNFGKKQTYEEQSSRYDYLYSPGELTEIDQKLREIYDKVKEVFVIMNNHPGGKAVANAFELIHLLRRKSKVKMPDSIVNNFVNLESMLN